MPLTHKFRAIPITLDGIRFDSKKEGAFYSKLKLMKKAGEVLFFLRQIPFQLPGQTKYFVDFQVFYTNGTIEFIDVKGVETENFKLKKRQVEELYPVEIKVVK